MPSERNPGNATQPLPGLVPSGLPASSKVLHKLDVPFAYIENCRVENLVPGLEAVRLDRPA